MSVEGKLPKRSVYITESKSPNSRSDGQVAQAGDLPTVGGTGPETAVEILVQLAPGPTAYLAAGTDLTQPVQVGANLHFLQPDGSVVVIEGGAVLGLVIYVGDVRIPAETMALLLEDISIDTSAGTGPEQQPGAHGSFEDLGPQSVGGAGNLSSGTLGNTLLSQRSDIPPNGAPNVVNTPPIAAVDRYEATKDTILAIGASAGVLSNDRDIDGNLLSSILVSDVAHGALSLNSDGSFSYVPDENFTGTDSFAYKANDGGADSNTVRVTINVSPANSAPVSKGEAYNTAEDRALDIDAPAGILANDNDSDGDTLTAVLVTDVAHGTLSLNINGSFSYTPGKDFSGRDSFSYRANDGREDGNTVTVNSRSFMIPVMLRWAAAKNSAGMICQSS